MTSSAETIIIGGGLAGLSAAVYLGRARREVLLIDAGWSMARWEPDVQNYLGFPGGIEGAELLRRGRKQARRYHVRLVRAEIVDVDLGRGRFRLRGKLGERFQCRRLLLSTGIFHIPPDIPGVKPCLGHSMFFCKDCDGYRVRGRSVAVYGWTNEAVEYALAMLSYSPRAIVVTDGRQPRWDKEHAAWIREYSLPVCLQPIVNVSRDGCWLRGLRMAGGVEVEVTALFTTRGDMYLNRLAKQLGAEVNKEGEVVVTLDMRTTVPGLYAAGCVTPANCQMIIAAGQGATAAQAINRDLFEQSLAGHALRRFRSRQIRSERTRPKVRRRSVGEHPISSRRRRG